MTSRPDGYTRRSIRLKGYDYAEPGAYFVTICTQYRECLFGDIAEGQMRPNAFGDVVLACWDSLPRHYPYVEPDAFAVMPNHVHGIIVLASVRAGFVRAGFVRAGFKPAPTDGIDAIFDGVRP